jgi:hypothetical protein
MFVSASIDPFSEQGAVYRRPIDGNGPLQPLGGGMPRWTDGAADTDCIATRDSMVAVIDKSGCLYVSYDDGATWSCPFDRLTGPRRASHLLTSSRHCKPFKRVLILMGVTFGPGFRARRLDKSMCRSAQADNQEDRRAHGDGKAEQWSRVDAKQADQGGARSEQSDGGSQE